MCVLRTWRAPAWNGCGPDPAMPSALSLLRVLCRSYFCYCFNVLPAAMAAPLALRFPRRPLLCLLCQALATCLLGPYPSYSDVALWLVRQG